MVVFITHSVLDTKRDELGEHFDLVSQWYYVWLLGTLFYQRGEEHLGKL